MRSAKSVALCVLILCCAVAAGKKKKVLLPDDVLQARTVFVMIDPNAGTSIEDPNANRIAQNDVENAISNWGRFTLTSDISNADLVIVVRKGSGRIDRGTIGGVPDDNPPMMGRGPANPSADSDPASRGANPDGDPQSPSMGGGQNRPGPMNRPHPEIEAGQVNDIMTVYRGRRDDALDTPAVWRYSANDGLESPSVPAVDAFRKLIAEAEKQQAKQP